MTNREFYLKVRGLVCEKSGDLRTLEGYLIALRALSFAFSDRDSIPIDDFFSLLERAFSAPLEPVALESQNEAFTSWMQTITEQIDHLNKARRDGVYENEYRNFGVGFWYNFETPGFLESAAVGTFGGWRDDPGRDYVPGEVVVATEDGLEAVDPRSLKKPTVEMNPIDWELFEDFLFRGATYE